MFRRPPTELELKNEDIDAMEDALLKLANKIKAKPVDMEGGDEAEVQPRMGLPPSPRIVSPSARDSNTTEQSDVSAL
ncbi:unnamed protein product [Anisakis simplex]|uniref:Charged multivesicular body protein 7 n=1 Tax=Anisakis simplex TaxID=6269 RepID=A0A0M3K602_ANISI|nr:unnamed protein product [Anisakis simplex]